MRHGYLRYVMCAAAIGATAACGQSEAQKQAQEASKQAAAAGQQAAAAGQQAAAAGQQAASAAQTATNGLAQMAQGLTQMAQGLQGGKNGQATPPVDYELLKPLVPDLDGWKKDSVKGEQMSMPFQVSHVKAHYSKDNSSIDLEITDSALNQLVIAPFSMFLGSGYSERSDDGYKKSSPVKGNPGFEEWEKDSKHAEVTAVVNNRFVVQGTGHDVESADVVRKLVESVDLAKLATLK